MFDNTFAIYKRNDTRKTYIGIVLKKENNAFFCTIKTNQENENDAILFMKKYILGDCFLSFIYFSLTDILICSRNSTSFSLN
jgi:hypothetical protein